MLTHIFLFLEDKEEQLAIIQPDGQELRGKNQQLLDIKKKQDYSHIEGEDYSLSVTGQKQSDQEDQPDGARDYQLGGMDVETGKLF